MQLEPVPSQSGLLTNGSDSGFEDLEGMNHTGSSQASRLTGLTDGSTTFRGRQ